MSVCFVIERKGFGRKNTMIYSAGILILLSGLLMIENVYLTYVVGVLFLSVSNIFTTLMFAFNL